ncbi:MAG: hypothetical protein WC647_12795 [Desulfomonilaceae bacterium]|jgi:hypothetical protein
MKNPNEKRQIVMCLLILWAPIGLSFIAAAIQDWNYVFDDSFITYRYAKNLAMGHGITWNIGQNPTEGYTNFLLVVVLAPFIKAGFDPLLVTRVISYASLVAIALILFTVARSHYGCSALSAMMVTALIFLVPETKSLCLLGMETIIYSLFLLTSFVAGMAFINRQRTSSSVVFSCLLFLTILLRPEATMLYPVIFVSYCVLAFRRNSIQLKPLIVGFLFLIAIGSVYLTWKVLYFGHLLPNPFYIKASGSYFVSSLGMRTVQSFFSSHSLILALIYPSLLMVFLSGNYRNNDKVIMLSAVSFLLFYLCFFARCDTLMDVKGRFLYPLIPLVICLIIPIFVWMSGVLNELIGRRLILLVGALIAFLLAFGPRDILEIYGNSKKLSPNNKWRISDLLMQKERRVATALANLPDIAQVRIAGSDSGGIPYFSGAVWLDIVGLNDSFIARTRDNKSLVDYFFNWNADLVIQESNKDGSWIQYGHGPLGDKSSWASDPRWDRYYYVGTVKTGGKMYDLQFFVNKSSKFSPSLESFLKNNVVDGWYDPSPYSIGTYKLKREIEPKWVIRTVPLDNIMPDGKNLE